jgi:hypothetical protein
MDFISKGCAWTGIRMFILLGLTILCQLELASAQAMPSMENDVKHFGPINKHALNALPTADQMKPLGLIGGTSWRDCAVLSLHQPVY